MRAFLIAAFLLALQRVSIAAAQAGSSNSLQRSAAFRSRLSKEANLQYLLYLPASYTSKENWPLIVYLHGGSARGDDVNKIREGGLPRRLEGERDFPFVVLSPLCNAGEIWTNSDEVFQLIDEIVSKYKVRNASPVCDRRGIRNLQEQPWR